MEIELSDTFTDTLDGTVELTLDASDENGAIISVMADNLDSVGIYLSRADAAKMALWLNAYAIGAL